MAVTVIAQTAECWLCWGLRYWYVKICHPGLNNDTVEHPVSNQQKCKDRWSLTGGGCLQESKHKGVSFKKRSRHISLMADNLLHEIV